MKIILGIALGALLMGCQQPVASMPSEPTPEPEVTDVATTSTGEMFYLEPKELAEQMALAKQGDNEAARRVADHYALGENDPKREYPWLVMAAERGDVAATRSLAMSLSEQGGQENCQKALEWLDRAKREGSPEELKKHAIDEAIAHLKAGMDACVRRS